MKLKNIGEKVQGKLRGLADENKENTLAEIIKDQVIQPTEDQQLSEEEIREKQAENLVNALQKNPEMQQALVQEAVKSDEISQAVIDTSAQIAAESSDVPDNVTGTLVKQASDDTTIDILQNEGISSRAIRMEAINSLEDEEKKEDAICKELEELYKSLKDFQSQQDIVQKLQDCLEKVDIERTSRIKEELYKTIARAFAIQYCEFDGSIRISPMEAIVPIDEMIREKIPQRVAEEYQDKRIVKSKTKEKRKLSNGKKKPINVIAVKKFFLTRMAKKVVGDAKKENRSVSVFMKNLGQLTDQEASYLENEFTNLGIETREVENIMRIAKGEIEESQEYIPSLKVNQEDSRNLEVEPKKANSESIKENKVIEKQETKQKERFDLSTLGTEEIKAIRDCIESGFIKNLGKVPSTMRKKLLGTINHSLEQRTRKIVEMAEKSKIVKAEDTPKVKKAEWGDDPR